MASITQSIAHQSIRSLIIKNTCST